MATGNLLLGQASGAVGSLVFSRANGKQLTKARQEQVRYSNTLAQAIQRICISTAGQAYRHMQEVCCRSFQGIQTGKATHDEFMKRNVRMLRQIIRQADALNLAYSDLRYFTPIGNDTLLPNRYIVSSGSLHSIIVYISANDPTHAWLTDVGVSYRDIITFYGLQRGDILTFVFMQPDSSGIVRARSARVVLDPRSPMGGMASLDVPFVAADNKINCPNPENTGEFTYLVSVSGHVIYSLVNSDVPLIAAGVFASRRTAAGSWMHSDCQLSLYNDSDILDKFTLQQAIDVANGAPIAAISPDYLNNAGVIALPGQIKRQYQRLQYIESDGSQYIKLSVNGSQVKRFIIQGICYSRESSNTQLLGTNLREISTFFGARFLSQTSNWYCLDSSSQPVLKSNILAKIDCTIISANQQPGIIKDIDRDIEINFSKLGASTWAFGSENLYLFGGFSPNRISPKAQCWFLELYDDSGLILNMLPVRRYSDGEVGMIDLVTNTFFASDGSASFIPGPVIN